MTRRLLDRFNIGSTKPKPAPTDAVGFLIKTLGALGSAPKSRKRRTTKAIGLHLEGTTLFDGGRWVADFNDIGSARAGLDVERRRRGEAS